MTCLFFIKYSKNFLYTDLIFLKLGENKFNITDIKSHRILFEKFFNTMDISLFSK